MTRAHAWLQHVSHLLVAGTGSAYFVMKHLLTSEDPFAVINHPWQPWAQHLHVLSAPLFVFAVGLSWASHAGPQASRASRPRWSSGLTLMVGLGPMVGSGYLLQVAVEPGWRSAWLWTHLATSALWVLGYAVHLVRPALKVLRPRVQGGA